MILDGHQTSVHDALYDDEKHETSTSRRIQMSDMVKKHGATIYGLVINDNIYWLMFALSYIYRGSP